ncbi:MAG: FHA domain-containing protein [Myxococcota bacterium]|nr:FHA domain-containing protein [Myxococcota bacterium]MDW8364005.1 FHA domain-containing protein [Myxococcales bacterium]
MPTRFRLRYQASDFELPPGEFVIGRSSSCSLAVDDALVSRRHAVLRVGESGVTVEDLGSRNGVLVNGERIEGSRALRHLDRIVIGAQELVLFEVDRGQGDVASSGGGTCEVCHATLGPDDLHCRACGAPAPRRAQTLAGATLEIRVPAGGWSGLGASLPEEPTRTAVGFALLAGIAEKALGLGRCDEAERLVGGQLELLVARASAGETLAADLMTTATRFALRLAEGLQQPRWVDYVFRLYAATRQVVPGPTVDRMHELVRRIGHDDPRALRAYLEVLAPVRDQLSASERFTLHRLEGLSRVMSA